MGNAFCYSCSPCEEQNHSATNIMPVVEDMQHIEDLIVYIDQLLREIENGGQKQVGRPNSVASSINSGGNLIEKLSRPLNWHVCKKCFLSALDRQTRKVVVDVLSQAQLIPYLGMALCVIAHLLERAEQSSSNKDEWLRLLRYMSGLAKHMKNLDIHLDRPKLNKILLFIVKETLMCTRQIEPNCFCRYISAPVDAGDLQNLESELVHLYPDLQLEALTEVLHRLPKFSDPSQGDQENAVGIELAKNKVIELLDVKNPSRRIVVIYGIGGIGKTTLATAVFSSLDLTGYHYCSVQIDQDCKESDLRAIQEQILRDLFKENLKLNNCTQGREKLSEAFGKSSKPVFLFIDNALRKNDIKNLLPIAHLSKLPVLSRILATTRNLNETNIFRLQGVIEVYPYRVDPLPLLEAKRLLCHHALGDKNGSFDRDVNIVGLLQICEGIPLVLEIVGSKLAADGNTVSACNEILEYLKEWQDKGFEGGEDDLSEVVVDFVYRRLKEPSTEAFLDIAFFFYNWERTEVADIVGEMQLRDLEGAALVTTSEGRVMMHDIVRVRGRKLSQGNRITDKESWSMILDDEQKLQQTKGICLGDILIPLGYDDFHVIPVELNLEAKHIDMMSRSLRVLFLGEHIRVNGQCERAFEDLRFMKISNEDMLPIDLSKSTQLVWFQFNLMKGHGISQAKFTINLPESLRLLHLVGYESDLPVSLDIVGDLTSLTELKVCKFTLQNVKTSHSLGNSSCLKTLKLNDTMLERLPESFGNLSSMEYLDMNNCSKLESLPQSFGNFCSLERLFMDHCSMLKTLPDSFGNLVSLKTLSMEYCTKLERLPESLGNLSSLEALFINQCKQLERLPESFGNLSSLQNLFIDHFDQLEILPESFGNLSSLQELEMEECSKLDRLPESFGNLYSLQKLSMVDCFKLEKLCENFGNLSSLQILSMDGCSKLERLPDSFGNLSSLERLTMDDCSMLESLPPSFGNLFCMQTLFIRKCSKLNRLPDSFGSLSSIQHLDMNNCSVERLPESFGNLFCMEILSMRNCSKLERLPESFGNLTSLETLEMDGCEKICSLSDNFVQLKCLKFLKISNCKELKTLPHDMVCLTSLAAIRAYGCAELEAKAMDSLVEMNSLLFLEMGESPMLIKRWGEIQQQRPLIGAALSFEHYPYQEIMSTMFFNGASRFLHIDGEGQLAEVASCSFPEVGVKMGLLLSIACDLSDEVRQKLVELASQEFQIIYVDVDVEGEAEASSSMEGREKRIRETLVQLPGGSRAWTSRFHKTRLLFAYSLKFFGCADTSIVGTSAFVHEDGRRKLSFPLEMIFGRERGPPEGICERYDFTSVPLPMFSSLNKAWCFIQEDQLIAPLDDSLWRMRFGPPISLKNMKEI